MESVIEGCAVKFTWSWGGSIALAQKLEIVGNHGNEPQFFEMKMCGEKTFLTCTVPLATLMGHPFHLKVGQQVQARVYALDAEGWSPAFADSTITVIESFKCTGKEDKKESKEVHVHALHAHIVELPAVND